MSIENLSPTGDNTNNENEDTPAIEVVEYVGGGARSEEEQERMETLRQPVPSREEVDARRREIEQRLEEIVRDHENAWRNEEEKAALERELEDLDQYGHREVVNMDADAVARRRNLEAIAQLAEDLADEDLYEGLYAATGDTAQAYAEDYREADGVVGDGVAAEGMVRAVNEAANEPIYGSRERTLEGRELSPETAFARAMTRIEGEDPDRANRIRKAIGLELKERREPQTLGEPFERLCRDFYRQQEEWNALQERIRTQQAYESAHEGEGGAAEAEGTFFDRLRAATQLGMDELRYAERFRRETKDVSDDMGSFVELLRQEEGLLSLEEAQREAQEMRRRFEQEGLESPDAEEYQRLSDVITSEKVTVNQELENRIVEEAIEKLEQSLREDPEIQEYLEREGGGDFSPEHRDELERRIRGAVRAIRRDQALEDVIDYKKLVRNTLNPNWYKRYVSGGVNLVRGAASFIRDELERMRAR